jgi:hypothetical protein
MIPIRRPLSPDSYYVLVSMIEVRGGRYMVHGSRYMVHGARYMVHGSWYRLLNVAHLEPSIFHPRTLNLEPCPLSLYSSLPFNPSD